MGRVLEVLDDVERWLLAGRQVALARVVAVQESSPRLPGAVMAVSEDGDVAGSVSGGCIDGAVVSMALKVLKSGQPRLHTFGNSDREAFTVGLTCGGTVQIFIEPARLTAPESGRSGDATAPGIPPLFGLLAGLLHKGFPVVLATVVEVAGSPAEEGFGVEVGLAPGARLIVEPDAEPRGSLGSRSLELTVTRDALGLLGSGTPALRRYGVHGEARRREVAVFIQPFVPPPRMLIIGALDFTAALARVAKTLGYMVTVCDARAAFVSPARFPLADRLVVSWPDEYLLEVGPQLTERDALCVLTHDLKFDVPTIMAGLGSRVGYIGAMGSRRTHTERLARLLEAGVSSEQLDRVMSPIGLDIGASTPEETAVAICAEIVARRHQGATGRSLRDLSGPIHRRQDEARASR